jgi:hypothetical protein
MLPTKRKKELTKKQSTFLDALFDNGGNVIEAMDIAGYHVGSRSNLMHSVKHEIVERARSQLAGSTVKSVNRLAEALDADGTIPNSQIEIRMKAANDILDRVGISKRQEVDIRAEVIHGVVLLPPKVKEKAMTIDG